MHKFLLVLFLILLSACQSTRPNNSSHQSDSAVNNRAVSDSVVNDPAVSDTAVNDQATPDSAINDMAVYALSLTGTRYKYGGTSPDSGFDCSGFVGHVFKHSLGKSLPRSSAEMSRVGVKQEYEMLRPGDLVFYNTLKKKYSHVGIYLGDGQFIHSPSTGKSVSIVNMNDSYYRKRYNGARRIMP